MYKLTCTFRRIEGGDGGGAAAEPPTWCLNYVEKPLTISLGGKNAEFIYIQLGQRGNIPEEYSNILVCPKTI